MVIIFLSSCCTAISAALFLVSLVAARNSLIGVLTKFAGIGTTAGAAESIELHVWPAWPQFGRGSFSCFDTYSASFSGEVDIPLVYKGAVNVSFDLTDRDPEAEIGPCRITVNGLTDHNATYKINDSRLEFRAEFKGRPRTLVMYRTGSQQECTMLEVKGAGTKTLRLRPLGSPR